MDFLLVFGGKRKGLKQYELDQNRIMPPYLFNVYSLQSPSKKGGCVLKCQIVGYYSPFLMGKLPPILAHDVEIKDTVQGIYGPRKMIFFS